MTPRQVQRMFPAPNIFVSAVASLDVLKTVSSGFTWKDRFTFMAKYNRILSTGYGRVMIYKSAMKRQWTLNIEMDANQMAQVVFHCWFGTYKEDFGVLSSIKLENHWVRRRNIKMDFQILLQSL